MTRRSKAQKPSGTCRLTGDVGPFVKSHILPKALTRSGTTGEPFIQSGKGYEPTRRWSSWVDNDLVTQSGEEILRDLDSWAIPKLREYHLVWSGWKGASSLPSGLDQIPDTPWGYRIVEVDDPQRLRLFALSLLWRAAASTLYEMSEINMPDPDLIQLTRMVRERDPHPLSFYPVVFTQLSTIGPSHNLTPLAMKLVLPNLGLETDGAVHPIFRLYLDGLTMHFYRPDDQAPEPPWADNIAVGPSSKLYVTTVTFEASFQAQNIDHITKYSAFNYPVKIDKLRWP